MSRLIGSRAGSGSTFAFWLLAALFVVLWLVGGASRADVPGQPLIRLAAWGALLIFTLAAPRPMSFQPRALAALLAAAVLLVALQLLPLPPAAWASLPGRELFLEAARIAGQPQPWRPLSVSPAGTANALGSLVAPGVVFVLVAQLNRQRHRQMVALLLLLVVCGGLLGLLQFSGARFDNPFINDVAGSVSGNFANRNHFGLFVAIGCLLLPVWAFREGSFKIWRAATIAGLVPFLLLIGLATGSRMGMLLSGLGLGLGFLIVRRQAVGALQRMPGKMRSILPAALILITLGAVVASISLDRAASVDRALTLESGADLRVQARPVVLGLTAQYFPAGAGFGTFDPVYRIAEPHDLLQPTYFNHAHNDWLEIVLEGGLPAIVLLAAAIGWWLARSWRVWSPNSDGPVLPRAGSAMILLIFLASVTDYPARTPMVMAVLVLGGVWLSRASTESSSARTHNRSEKDVG